jgi:hypothetical protein
MALQRHRTDERRRDTREKIQLGGLIAKAGLRNEDKAVLLGLLVEAAEALKDNEARERYRLRGKAIFDNDQQTARTGERTGAADDRGVLRTSRD